MAAQPVKQFIVTGANGTIGKEIVKGLAKTGSNVVLAVRRRDAGEKTIEAVAKEANIPKENMKVMEVDLSSQHSIRKFVADFTSTHQHLHGIVQTASIVSQTKKLSVDNIELTFATNVMPYFLFMELFQDILKKTGPSRIVNVASNYAGHLDLSDLQFEKRPYNHDSAYRQSKQCERMLSWVYADKLRDTGVTVNACHPGVVTSPLLAGLMSGGGSDSPEKGAVVPLFVALNPDLEKVTGKYYYQSKEKACQFSDKKQWIELWEKCNQLLVKDPKPAA